MRDILSLAAWSRALRLTGGTGITTDPGVQFFFIGGILFVHTTRKAFMFLADMLP